MSIWRYLRRTPFSSIKVPLRLEKGYFVTPSKDLSLSLIEQHLSITFVYNSSYTMEDLSKFKKPLKDIMRKDSEHFMSHEEIYFDSLVIDVIELVGDRWVMWLN